MIRPRISPTFRIALGLTSLMASLVLFAGALGLFPDERGDRIRTRQRVCESAAMSFSALANRVELKTLQQYFENIAARNDDIETIGLRRADGAQALEVGNHFETWSLAESTQSTESEICIPVYGNDQLWGTVEIRFQPIDSSAWGGLAQRPEFVLAAFMSCVGLFVFFVYLRIVMRQLNPSRVVPSRVRDALDALAEGLLVLDKNERIVLANDAFQTSTGRSSEDLIGKRASVLPFICAQDEDDSNEAKTHPWLETIATGAKVQGRLLKIATQGNRSKTFLVNCAPINDDKGRNRGAIVGFEDVTQLEARKDELKEMVQKLDASTTEIMTQNRELEILATRDALTGSLNRRSFFQKFDQAFSSASKNRTALSAFMVDIDHFKGINDNHGHATGDLVLQKVATALQDNVRKSDLVCRYGGEEFAILLPRTDIHQAAIVAEGIRDAIEKLEFPNLSVTTSLGLSAICQSPENPQELLEQADKCLYVAKRNGRNQVVRWDDVPDDVADHEPNISHANDQPEFHSEIPFHAVTALISALAYRDQETANHSRRVADLCVAVGESLLSIRDCYVLEIAGLLHDIGKIGVPDSILLKSSPLSEQEWQVMKKHERIGIEIVNSSFASYELNEIIENYRTFYDQGCRRSNSIPIGARILAIADAYDSMTAHHPYRQCMTQRESIAELRRCAGDQFDPEIVEQFIQVLKIRGRELADSHDQISKAAALNIGAQIERLVTVLDNRDPEGISAIAIRLEGTALKFGATPIAEKAKSISEAMQNNEELFEIIQHTNELLDLCRSSQHSLIGPSEERTNPTPFNRHKPIRPPAR